VRGAAYSSVVSAWLLDERPLPSPDPAFARRFGRWSEQRRRGWLRAHYAEFRRCALRLQDVSN
jgi:hypothetical protein